MDIWGWARLLLVVQTHKELLCLECRARNSYVIGHFPCGFAWVHVAVFDTPRVLFAAFFARAGGEHDKQGWKQDFFHGSPLFVLRGTLVSGGG